VTAPEATGEARSPRAQSEPHRAADPGIQD
jgi:hypothetical protein